MVTQATGKIEVKTWDERSYSEVEGGPTLVRVAVTESFTGDIEGDGDVTFLQVVRPDGSASFVGVERVTGRVGGRSGTFVLQDEGTLEGGVVKGTWFVVPGSGTGELQGLQGQGGFEAALGQHASITLDYSFADQ
ncbi:MAG: DUF3224 domain-containing protein [Candidatus Dormibacteraeota bacterium]|nr:DUF3224 domain-containing protein [Candidatus Dormibacteraeota bacterium]